MRPRALLDDLRRRGFTLWLEDDKIRFRGTREPLTHDLLAGLKSNKPDLVQILAGESSESCIPLMGYKSNPYITQTGDLVIPFDSDPKYHWWKPGSLRSWEIRDELKKRLVN